MPTYQFEAIDASTGKEIRDVVDAPTEAEAQATIRSQGYMITKIKVQKQAAAAGAAGLLVPDLPLEEAERLSPIAAAAGLDLVLLVAPTTPPQRMARIVAASRGFTYLVSVTGVTGERSQMETRVAGLVQQIKALGSTPVAVGFGISGVEQAVQVRDWGADGAIVGSALVKRMALAEPVAAAQQFCSELRTALDS